MKTFAYVLMLIFVASCSSQIYYKHELVQQILKPRTGFKGLTNRICLEYNGPVCKRPVITEYLFEDQMFRNSVNKLGFICKVASKRYKICIDKPGLCRISYKRSGFLNLGRERLEDYLPASNYQYLIDAGTKCFQKAEYDFDSI